MLSMDFEEEINKILAVLPSGRERTTFLFSATMTSKVTMPRGQSGGGRGMTLVILEDRSMWERMVR
jgi:hypothetical protein